MGGLEGSALRKQHHKLQQEKIRGHYEILLTLVLLSDQFRLITTDLIREFEKDYIGIISLLH